MIPRIPKYVPFISVQLPVFPEFPYTLQFSLSKERLDQLIEYHDKEGPFIMFGHPLSAIASVGVINEMSINEDGSTHIGATTYFRVRHLEHRSKYSLLRRWERVEEVLPTQDAFKSYTFQSMLNNLFLGYARLNGNADHENMPYRQAPETVGKLVDEYAAMFLNAARQHEFIAKAITDIFNELDVTKRLEIANWLCDSMLRLQINLRKDGKPPSWFVGSKENAEKSATGNDDGDLPDFMKDVDINTFPPEAQKAIRKSLKELSNQNPSSPEHTVTEKYLEELITVPWTKETEDNFDLTETKTILDEDHYGLEYVKETILEHLAVRRLNPKTRGMILCLGGPPGVGKTSLGKSIARAMGRKFVRMSLGGVRDEADIRGHRRTYIGSMSGRIIKSMKDVGVINPVFMLDEVDKLGRDSARGSPEDALLEVLDPEQNSTFVDHYLGIPYDLSRVFFIATANDVSAIIPALRDRMEVIYIPGYAEKDKLQIARRHLIPKQLKEVGLNPEAALVLGKEPVAAQFSDGALKKIINEYTSEAGVRKLERAIKKILRKIARSILEKASSHAAVSTEKDNGATDPTLPPGALIEVVRITDDSLPDYLGHSPLYQEFDDLGTLPAGVGPVLMVGNNGEGSIEMLEVSLSPREKLDVKNTGLLKQVLDESIDVSISRLFHNGALGENISINRFIHSHLDSGAISKDGPSAGVMHYVTLYSAFTGIPIRPYLAITGEITLKRNAVLPVGGIEQKILAGKRMGLREICIPKTNLRDLEKLPDDFKEKLDTIIPSEINLENLKLIARSDKKDRFTVYAIDIPEQALAIAFPDHYPELPAGFKLPEELMAAKSAESTDGN